MAGDRVKTGAGLKRALKALGEQCEDECDAILQKLTLDGFGELVRRTPVDTGFLRSRWAVSVNTSPPADTVRNPGSGGFPPASTPRLKPVWGDRVYLYNNTEYAYFIEHGTPTMRAQPMVEPTYFYLVETANRLTKALKNKRTA